MKLLISRQSIFVFVTLLFALISSCNKQENRPDSHLDVKLKEVDSLISQGDKTRVLEILSTINVDDYKSLDQKVSYHLLSAVAHKGDYDRGIAEAKEAFLLFNNPEIIRQEKELYFKTLVTNGELSYSAKNYLTAFSYLAEAKALLKPDDCQNGFIFGKFANIFFDQKNYATAAKYYLKSYQMTVSCNPRGKVKTDHYFPGMSLNNVGFSFFKNKQLDSASYYYQKFDEQIDTAFAKKKINTAYVSTLKSILYDNLGGLYIEKGDLKLAESYLKKSLALPVSDVGARLPPNLKLGRLYTQTGDYVKASEALEIARGLLSTSERQSFTYNSTLQKAYINYFKKSNQPDSAYLYQNLYFDSLDSLNKLSQDLSSFDVAKELEVITQRQELNELRHSDQVRRVYVAGLIEFLVLVVIIITIVYLNLRKVKKLHRESVKNNEVITSTVEELERANKNYIRIMRIMAHDLRNPLSGMAGLASAVLDDVDLDEDTTKMLKLIESTGLHSIEMINELLKTGLANEDKPIETQKLDLKALLYDSVELLRFKAKEKQQQIEFDDNDFDKSVFASVNYEKIWRVLNNLLVNAIKFSLIGGKIKVGIKEYKTSVVIFVSDNGIGIADKDKETVFDMFTEAKRTGTNGEQPFGLGLSISRKIMEKHNGKVWFESNITGGTTFFIEFPKGQ